MIKLIRIILETLYIQVFRLYVLGSLSLEREFLYEGPARRFVTGFELLQGYVLSNIFLLQTFKPLLKHIFVTFLPSREKQTSSPLLVSVGNTDK